MIKSILLCEQNWFNKLYIGNKSTTLRDVKQAFSLNNYGMKFVRELYYFNTEDTDVRSENIINYYQLKYDIKHTYFN